jgi:TRAP-type transport system small permease protein
MMNTLDRMSVAVEAAIRILVVVIFAFMLGAVLLDVAARNSAFRVRGLDELARYSQIWFIFLVTGVGARYGELIGTDVVVNALPRRLKVAAWLVNRLLMFVFLGLLAWYAWLLLEFIIRTGRPRPTCAFPCGGPTCPCSSAPHSCSPACWWTCWCGCGERAVAGT